MTESFLHPVRALPDWAFPTFSVAAALVLLVGATLVFRRTSRRIGVHLLCSVALGITSGVCFYHFGGDYVSFPPIDAPDPITAFAQSIGYALDFARMAYLVGVLVLASGLVLALPLNRRRTA